MTSQPMAKRCPAFGVWTIAAALALLPTGCKLVDQRTFNPQAGVPPFVARPPAPAAQPDRTLDGLAPLVTIRLDRDRGYDEAVAQAAAAVLARKRDAQFTVLTALPPSPPDAQADAVARYAPEAARVADLLARRGVSPARVRLEARAEPNLGTPELRLYVR